MSDHPHILVATLGGQPQIVTFTLDLLLQHGFPITDVFVIHPKALSEEFRRIEYISLFCEKDQRKL